MIGWFEGAETRRYLREKSRLSCGWLVLVGQRAMDIVNKKRD